MNTGLLVWGLLFGSLGGGYLLYGWRQKALVPLVCGSVLAVLPYLVANTVVLIVIGVVFAVLPYFVRP